MIRNLLYLLLLEICFANGQSEYTLKLLNKKEYYVNTSKIVYYGPPGIPPLPDTILIDDVQDIKEKFIARANFDATESFRATEKFILHYRNLTFYNLSSAYSLEYKIDLAAQKVEAVLTLSTAQLKGQLSVSTPTSSISTINFAMNFHTVFLSYEMSFEISNGTVLFEKTIDRLPYISMATEVPEDMKKYWTRKLLETVSARLNEEVRQHRNLDSLRFQIEREISSIYRAALGERFRKTVSKAFQSEGIGANIINLMVHSNVTFSSIRETKFDEINPYLYTTYNITVPSFALRFQEKTYLEKNIGKILFHEDEIHLRCEFILSSPRLVATIVYRNESELEDKTLVAEYQLRDISMTFKLVARLDTASIELTSSKIEPRYSSVNFNVQLADDQDNFQDIRDFIIRKAAELIDSNSFIEENCDHTLRHYINGVLADGRIAEEVFKDD